MSIEPPKPVDELTSLDDRFKCVPLHSVITVATCEGRRNRGAKTSKQSSQAWASTGAGRGVDPTCAKCELGQLVSLRVRDFKPREATEIEQQATQLAKRLSSDDGKRTMAKAAAATRKRIEEDALALMPRPTRPPRSLPRNVPRPIVAEPMELELEPSRSTFPRGADVPFPEGTVKTLRPRELLPVLGALDPAPVELPVIKLQMRREDAPVEVVDDLEIHVGRSYPAGMPPARRVKSEPFEELPPPPKRRRPSRIETMSELFTLESLRKKMVREHRENLAALDAIVERLESYINPT
jgi:hypothetical protein